MEKPNRDNIDDHNNNKIADTTTTNNNNNNNINNVEEKANDTVKEFFSGSRVDEAR